MLMVAELLITSFVPLTVCTSFIQETIPLLKCTTALQGM